MKHTTALVAILLITSLQPLSATPEKDVYIESASQFQNWCKKESYRHFRRKKQHPYNWSASTIRQLNDYQTTGSWKVNNVEKHIYCEIRIGKKARKRKIKIR